MAEDKKSFVLYADLIHVVKKLPKETSGALFLHILEYVNDLNPVITDDLLLEISFEPIKQQLKRDLREWEGKKMLRSESGRLGGIKSGESRRKKHNEANEATLHELEANEANEAVNVTVTVNDTVTNKGDKSPLPNGGKKPKDVVVGIKKNDQLKIQNAPKKKVAQKKKGPNPDSEPYWHQLRKKWVWFNKTHLKFNVEPIPQRDYSHMHRIIEKLRERAVGQAVEWTEDNALTRWERFLTIAYTKDDWLSKHFLLGNLESKMQQVFKLIDSPNGQHTKTGRQGSTTSSVGKTIEFDRP